MSSSESTRTSFDILSYPRAAAIDQIVVDLPESSPIPEHPLVRRVARTALSGQLVEEIDGNSHHTMLISDSKETVEAALLMGMGAIHVTEADQTAEPFDILLNPKAITDEPLYQHPLYTPFNLPELAETLYRPDEITVVGFVGRTGAGKSTTIRNLIPTLEDQGGHGTLFEIDAFFVRSRTERKAWLNEVGISDEERAKRQRVLTWWDLDRAIDTLQQIKNGEHIKLDGLYDMRRGGEMVGSMDINPNQDGFTVFVEGTALLIPEFRVAIDSYIYMNTHDHVRAAHLRQRNARDGYTPEESVVRKSLTDAAETNDHLAEDLRKQRFEAGSLTVLDNSHTDNQLRLMPPFIPRI